MSLGARVAYWAGALGLIGFGALAIFSIGLPFLVVGLTLVALAPFRGRPGVFWPVLSAVVAFFVGYVPVAPWGCAATATAAERPGGQVTVTPAETICTSPLGIEYSGPGASYDPPRWPAAAVGLVLAGGGGVLARRVATGHRERDGPSAEPSDT